MGGSLSQEEIDALLKGSGGGDTTTADEPDLTDNTALGTSPPNENGNAISDSNASVEVDIPNEMERGLLGEIYNISMGAAAQAVATLVKMKVDITTPNVRILKKGELVFKALEPAVGVKINYIEGIEGENVFILSQFDIMKLVDIVLGGTGEIDETTEFTEMHMSAVGEIMNQMMGASSMNIAEFLNMKIDISVPETFKIESDYPMHDSIGDDWIVATDFKFIVGDIINSEMISTCSLPFANDLIYKAMSNFGMIPEDTPPPSVDTAPPVQQSEAPSFEPEPEPVVPVAEPIPESVPEPVRYEEPVQPQPEPQPVPPQTTPPPQQQPQPDYQIPPQQQPPPVAGQYPPQQPYYYPQQVPGFDPQQMYMMFAKQQEQMMQLIEKISTNQAPASQPQSPPQPQDRNQTVQPAPYNQQSPSSVNILQPASFVNFDATDEIAVSSDNMGLVLDLPLDVSVEIGRTKQTVNEVLELGEGSVIELDKQVGDPFDICVNGSVIARGSVVVSDETFAIRITEIVSPQDKLKAARGKRT